MKKILALLLFSALVAIAQNTTLQKTPAQPTGSNANKLTDPSKVIVVGDGGSITATGSGVIVATGAPPTGTAGGDLTGTYPNPRLSTSANPTFASVTSNGMVKFGPSSSAPGTLTVDANYGSVLRGVTGAIADFLITDNDGNRILRNNAGSVDLTAYGGLTLLGNSVVIGNNTINRSDVVLTSPPSSSLNNQLVFMGDSLTVGVGGGPWTQNVVTTQVFDKHNVAVGGYNFVLATPASYVTVPPFRTGLGRYNFLHIWLGTNAIAGGSTPQQAFDQYSALCTLYRSRGYVVFVATMISRLGLDTQKNAFNALVRNGWWQFADGLSDIAANPNLGADGAWANTTYFIDTVHLTTLGYSLVTGIVQDAINNYTEHTVSTSRVTASSQIGTGATGFAEFSSTADFGGAATYALQQDPGTNGSTNLNAKPGGLLNLRVGNTNAAVITTAAAIFTGNVVAGAVTYFGPGSSAAGTASIDTNFGLVLRGNAGGVADFLLTTGSGSPILRNSVGTNNLVAPGNVSITGTVTAANLTGSSSGTNTGDQNIFGSVVVSGQSTVTASANPTALTLVAGNNVTLTTDNTAKSVTITAVGNGNVTTSSNFGTDERIIRSDGAGKTVQASPVSIDDSGNITGASNITIGGTFTFGSGPSSAGTIVNDTNFGMVVRGTAGAVTDLLFTTSAGTPILRNSVGTADMSAYGGIATIVAGKTFSVKSGSNALAGTVTLVAGSATITSTAIDSNTVIVFSEKTAGGTPGLYQPLAAVSAGSATVTSVSTDTSTYNWVALKVN